MPPKNGRPQVDIPADLLAICTSGGSNGKPCEDYPGEKRPCETVLEFLRVGSIASVPITEIRQLTCFQPFLCEKLCGARGRLGNCLVTSAANTAATATGLAALDVATVTARAPIGCPGK